MHKQLLSLLLVTVTAACSTDRRTGRGGEGGDEQGGCPASPAYTGMVCHAEDVGPTCPGTAACFCDSPINIQTTCVCQDDSLSGKSWKCEDDCASACMDGSMPQTSGLGSFTPSNLGAFSPPDGLADVTVSGQATCKVDTATGSGPCLGGANAFVAQTVQGFDVLVARSLTVSSNTILQLRGSRPTIIVATESINIQGGIDVGYFMLNLLDQDPRPGALDSGAGVGSAYHGGAGACAKGGGDLNGDGGGAIYGNPELVPLVGGSNGAGETQGGGGALQLLAGKTITVDGFINASGMPGYKGNGGGSGGSVLLEAPTVSGKGGVLALGGKGGDNINTSDGGGPGGAGDKPQGQDATVAYAGGGGAAGRIRINAGTNQLAGMFDPSEASTCATKGALASP